MTNLAQEINPAPKDGKQADIVSIASKMEREIERNISKLDAIDGVIPFTEALGKGEIGEFETELDWLVREACRLAAPSVGGETPAGITAFIEEGMDIFWAEYETGQKDTTWGAQGIRDYLENELPKLLARLTTPAAGSAVPLVEPAPNPIQQAANELSDCVANLLAWQTETQTPEQKANWSCAVSAHDQIVQRVKALAGLSPSMATALSAASPLPVVVTESAADNWVSVKDRLPDNTIFQGSHMVLVHLWNGTQLAAYYDYAAGFWREHTEGEKLTVTHWQPLPTPPGTVPTDKDR